MIVILPDVHLGDNQKHTDYEVVKRFISKNKSDEIILLGDFVDISSLSAWDLSKRRKMEGRRYEKECEEANRELDFLQKYTKKITYIEGNHEERVERYIDVYPELEGIIEVPKKLKLKERGIKYIPLNELYKVGNMYFTHGIYLNQYHAMKHLTRLGCNICYGHSHQSQTAMMNAKMLKPHMAYALGCLCEHSPDYMKGKPASWLSQFAIMETFGKNFNLYPVNIIENQFMFNNKLYK